MRVGGLCNLTLILKQTRCFDISVVQSLLQTHMRRSEVSTNPLRLAEVARDAEKTGNPGSFANLRGECACTVYGSASGTSG